MSSRIAFACLFLAIATVYADYGRGNPVADDLNCMHHCHLLLFLFSLSLCFLLLPGVYITGLFVFLP